MWLSDSINGSCELPSVGSPKGAIRPYSNEPGIFFTFYTIGLFGIIFVNELF